ADLRFEAMFSRSSSATDGEARSAQEGESAGFGLGVRVADRTGVSATGQAGLEVGPLAARPAKLLAATRRAMEESAEQADAAAREKWALIRTLGTRARGLSADAVGKAQALRDDVSANYRRDPRSVDLDELKSLTREASARIRALGAGVAFNAVAALIELRE